MAIWNTKYASIGSISRRPHVLLAFLFALFLLYLLKLVLFPDGYGSPKEMWPNQNLYDDLLERNPVKLNFTNPLVSVNSDLVVLIISHADDYQSRKDIRQTWANNQYSNTAKNGSLTPIFVVGSSFEDTHNESAMFNDVLVVDVKESYRNLVYKGLASFRWLSIFRPTVAMAKIDSDVVVKMDELYNQVHQYDLTKLWIFGSLWRKPIRTKRMSNKWFSPSEVYSGDYFPDFVSGPLYAMSAPSLRYLMKEAPNKKVLELEDAWFTGILATAAGIPRYDHPGIHKRKIYSQHCRPDGSPTVLGYPLHFESNRLDASDEYQHLLTVPCKTSFQKFVDYFWPY